jgi:hypothetical protein
MGYMIKGMMPIIETTNSIRKATLKKESFEPAKNLRKTILPDFLHFRCLITYYQDLQSLRHLYKVYQKNYLLRCYGDDIFSCPV